MFKKFSLIKVAVFSCLSIILINQHCIAKTSHEPEILGKPLVVYEAMDLAAHAFALTEDGKRIYVLKSQKLIIFQIYPFKFTQSFDVNFKNLPKKARDYMVFRMWVTSDEHFLNIVTRDKVIQFDLLAGKISQTLVFENKEVYRSASFNDDLWLFYRNTSIKNSILLSPKYLGEEGQGNTGPNASSIDVLDAHSLKFKKDLSSLFGREFMNSAADRVAQIDDKIIWFQPYGFGFYGQNTDWLRVIDSNSYQEELRILGEGIPLLNLEKPIVYLTHTTKVQDFYKPKGSQVTNFAKKHISFDLKTRQIKQLEDTFYKNVYLKSGIGNAVKSSYLEFNRSTYYVKHKDFLVSIGKALFLYNVKTKQLLKLFVDAGGESILMDSETGEFMATPGARRYLYFKHAEDKYLPITDKQYQQFDKSSINLIKE